jgi:DNA repair protein RadA/Sms
VEQAQPAKETTPRAASLGRSRGAATRAKASQPRLAMTLHQIQDHPQARLPSGYGELDRVLGGGIVPGSLVLLGGDPGIGKSTLLLQVANQLAARQRVLYVCAEESGQQVKLRWQRLGAAERGGEKGAAAVGLEERAKGKSGRRQGNTEALDEVDTARAEAVNTQLFLLPEIDLETILMELESLQPTVAIIDSIQALFYNALTSAPGSVSQVRECTSALMQLAKAVKYLVIYRGPCH